MRDELKQFDWHVYGLCIDDFNYTYSLTKKMIETKEMCLKQEIESVKGKYPEDVECEIISDISYYSWVEVQYVWHFCLWRLQGIFEGIITTKFIKNKKHFKGLKDKLYEIRNHGYSILDSELEEILQWGRLRNALSHCPPEQYRPLIIEESDILEYINLLKKLTIRWEDEFTHSQDT